MKRNRSGRILKIVWAALLTSWAAAEAMSAGPLRIHPNNPRYFTDDGGKAIYLTGSHTWNSLVDMDKADPGREYLVYLPEKGEATVDLRAAQGTLSVEWLNPADGTTTPVQSVVGGEKRVLQTPFGSDADWVLHLKGKQ